MRSITYGSTYIARDRYQNGRNHSSRGRGRSGGRGGRGGDGKMEINGVDVSNPTRTFIGEEMIKLGKVGRDYIFANRDNRDRGSGQNTDQQRNVSETSTTNTPNSGTPQNTDDDNNCQRSEKGAKNGSKFGNRN